MTIRRALLVAALGMSATLLACTRTPTASEGPPSTPPVPVGDAVSDSTGRGGEASGSGY